MPQFPTSAEIADYAAAHGLTSLPRSEIATRILKDREPPRSLVEQLIDPDTFCGGLKAVQDAADEHGVRPEVLAAAIPVVARPILAHSLYDTKDMR